MEEDQQRLISTLFQSARESALLRFLLVLFILPIHLSLQSVLPHLSCSNPNPFYFARLGS